MEDIKNIEDLNSELTYDLGTNYGHLGECLLKKTILFELKIPYLIIEKSIAKTKSVSFFSCKFYDTVKLERNEENITFEDCIFYSKVDAFNTVFKGKVRFRNCEFKGETSFSNTRFNGLADFWNCTFSKPTTFYKTDFNETVVFSGATFKENLLFTYSLFGIKQFSEEQILIKELTFPKQYCQEIYNYLTLNLILIITIQNILALIILNFRI